MYFDPRLYLIVERSLISGRSIREVVLELVTAGVTLVQLRDKTLTDDDMVSLGRELNEALKSYEIPLIINDRIHVARRVRAAGVHLGQSDENSEVARRILGKKAIIGLSCENLAQALSAQTLPIDYVSASPVFVSPTKRDTLEPWGIKGLGSLRSSIRRPIVAIGGISRKNIQGVIEAGADGVALASALLNLPAQEVMEMRELVDRALGRTRLQTESEHKNDES